MLKTNLLLALVLAVLGGFALWYEYKQKPINEKKQAEQAKVFVGADQKELESIKTYSNAGHVSLVCRKNCKMTQYNAEWDIVDPIQFRADESAVTSALNTVLAATTNEIVSVTGLDDPILQNFGLDKDKREHHRTEIRMKGDASPYILYVGDKSPLGENTYVLATGPGLPTTKVYLVAGYIPSTFDRKVGLWRYKKLFEFANIEARSLEIQGPQGRLSLVRKGNDWFLEPQHSLADSETVETLLTSISTVHATDFVSDNKNADRKKLDMPAKPKYTARINLEQKEPVVIEVFENTRKPPEFYITTPSKAYIAKVDLGVMQKFQKKSEDFRLKQLLRAVEKLNVKTVKVAIPKQGILETKLDGAQWTLTRGDVKNFDSSAVEKALASVGALRVIEFLGKTALPSQAQEVVDYDLYDQDKKILRGFKIYKKTGSKPGEEFWFVKFSDGEVGKLDTAPAKVIPHTFEEFTKKT